MHDIAYPSPLEPGDIAGFGLQQFLDMKLSGTTWTLDIQPALEYPLQTEQQLHLKRPVKTQVMGKQGSARLRPED